MPFGSAIIADFRGHLEVVLGKRHRKTLITNKSMTPSCKVADSFQRIKERAESNERYSPANGLGVTDVDEIYHAYCFE